MNSINLIVDCQWGSTGKGLLAGYLAERHCPDLLACASSPNAGHTYISASGMKLVHRMLPLGITSKSLEQIVFGPGSLIDLDTLHQEIIHAEQIGMLDPNVKILIHKNAAIVLDRHRDAESNGGTAPGSTRKGVGAAQIERIQRSATSDNIALHQISLHPIANRVAIASTAGLQRAYHDARHIQVEGCQGYSLSLYHGQYPYCTSRDVTTVSLLADCGIPMQRYASIAVYGVFRTYPIRVANRPASGEWSGPTYPDSCETTFESLGQAQELTTVTQLPRRIFTFSKQQAIEACVQNRVDHVFLNFAQYPPDWETLRDIWFHLDECSRVAFMGFGPKASDIVRIGSPHITESHVRSLYESARVTARDC